MRNATKTFNIKFPLEESDRGSFLKMTESSNEKAVSNFLFFLSLKDNELLYKNNASLNIVDFLFQPLDDLTMKEIKTRIEEASSNFENLKIKEINFEKSESNFLVGVNLVINIFSEQFNVSIQS
jgi:response regulator RpfG family c-di-GMP phosphodiesterase